MPPDSTPEPVVTTTAASAAPAPVAAKGQPSTESLIQKHAAAAASVESEPVAPDAKAKPDAKPAPAKAEQKPAKIDPKTIKLESEPKAKPAEPGPEPDAGLREKARYYLQHGDVAKAIEAGFGDVSDLAMADDVREALARKLGVGSQQWEKIRKYEQGAKRQLAAREQQVTQLVDQVRQEYAGFNQAKAAYDAGDYETAFKAAFGEDLSDFQRKAIGQRISKNPEVEQLKVQLERERQARVEFERRQQEAAEQADQQRHIQAYVAELTQALQTSDDPQIAEYSKKQRFVDRVFQLQREAYQASGKELPTTMAAAQARDEVQALLGEWEYSGGDTAQSVQAAAQPEQPTRAPARVRNLAHARAAEATPSPKKLPTKDLIAKYAKQIDFSATR